MIKRQSNSPRRSKGTTKPFPDLNREALAYVLDAIEKKQKGEYQALEQQGREMRNELGKFLGKKRKGEDVEEEILNLQTALSEIKTKQESLILGRQEYSDEDKKAFDKAFTTENFVKLYAWAIDKITPASQEALTNTEGQWIKYDQNSDNMPLVESLQGHGTGWCTAGESTAQTQLEAGDFYAYYSLDQDGKPTVPRAAIRMEGSKIAEVRGIASEQNLDSYIAPVVQEKLQEFPDGKAYDKKVEDMKLLTGIEHKQQNGQDLTKEDLSFLYEIKAPITGFGYKKDPRIQDIIDQRDIRSDISFIIDCTPEQISLTEEEALSGNILFHYGDLDLTKLTSAEGLSLPESVEGDLYLIKLTSAEGLTLPEHIGGGLSLGNLKSAEGLTLPESIGGTLNLGSLTSAEGLSLPESIEGALYLNDLTSAKGLTLPENIGGDLYLNSLTSAEGLTLPQNIGGGLNLNGLTSAKGLTLPENIGGDLSLHSLTSAEDLTLPKSIEGYLYLGNLTSVKGLTLPENIRGSLGLNSLTSAEGLTLPDNIGGFLNLPKITSAKGLTLPENIGGDLNLNSLTSAEGLTLPKSIGGVLGIHSLTSAEKDELREKYPNLDIV